MNSGLHDLRIYNFSDEVDDHIFMIYAVAHTYNVLEDNDTIVTVNRKITINIIDDLSIGTRYFYICARDSYIIISLPYHQDE